MFAICQSKTVRRHDVITSCDHVHAHVCITSGTGRMHTHEGAYYVLPERSEGSTEYAPEISKPIWPNQQTEV